MARAWVKQKTADIQQHGDKAPWFVEWYDDEGRRKSKSFGPGYMGKKRADSFRSKIENELYAGTYRHPSKTTWEKFVEDYEKKVLVHLAVGTREESMTALRNFQRLTKSVNVSGVNAQHIDDYKALRIQERGRKPGATVSKATVNKELRHIKAALRKAHEWDYLVKVPKIEMLREVKKIPTYVTPEHFAAMYNACDIAKHPGDLPYPPSDWWRALLSMAYMTGWRIGDLLALSRDDLNLDEGTAITRGDENKGKRDAIVKLHRSVVEHLRKIQSFERKVFPWYESDWTLYGQFHAIQVEAGIHLPCRGKHEHTDRCHVYGFHDLRRGFATMNAGRLSAPTLQSLMRHESFETTQLYIDISNEANKAIEDLYVPDVLKSKVGE